MIKGLRVGNPGEQAEKNKTKIASKPKVLRLNFFCMNLKYNEWDRGKYQQENKQHKSSQEFATRIQLSDLV